MENKKQNNREEDFKKFAKEQGVSTSEYESYKKAMTPAIIEERELHVTQMDVFSRLMMDRIIFLGTNIDASVANIINAQLLYLDTMGDEDVEIFINCPGGEVYSGLGIIDTMNYITSEVSTINMGLAASMAFVVATNGSIGKRYSLRNARFMQHQPKGGVEGQASDIEIEAKEIARVRSDLFDIISENTGQDKDTVQKDCDRDHWLSAQEAKEYGAIDDILLNKNNKNK